MSLEVAVLFTRDGFKVREVAVPEGTRDWREAEVDPPRYTPALDVPEYPMNIKVRQFRRRFLLPPSEEELVFQYIRGGTRASDIAPRFAFIEEPS